MPFPVLVICSNEQPDQEEQEQGSCGKYTHEALTCPVLGPLCTSALGGSRQHLLGASAWGGVKSDGCVLWLCFVHPTSLILSASPPQSQPSQQPSTPWAKELRGLTVTSGPRKVGCKGPQRAPDCPPVDMSAPNSSRLTGLSYEKPVRLLGQEVFSCNARIETEQDQEYEGPIHARTERCRNKASQR